MSFRLRLIAAGLRFVAKPFLRRMGSPERAAKEFDLLARLVFRKPPRLRIRESSQGSHWIAAGPFVPGKVILYLHGGGYISGSPRSHAGMLGRLSLLAGVEVCAPCYRLAPAHPFPAAFDDAVAAWDHLMALGYAPGDVVIGGDSAGGGLCLALLSDLCRKGTPPAGAFVFSPWTDLSGAGESVGVNAAREAIFPPERLTELAEIVLAGADAKDPRASPLFAEFPSPPPVLFQVGSEEILLDDTRRMAEVLRIAGGETVVEVMDGAPHVWQLLDGWLPEARSSLGSVAEFVQASLGIDSR
ncbi:MAG: alpha/beta hydrolase [Rhodobacteraceae bacterium]|nr:alpha/beta hydrolase [Paracoccaceae bacterium]